MLIEIFADFSCPWCFIGRRRLARALSLRPQISAEIVWQPFQLNPDIPPGGFERQAYLRGKFIDRERIRAMEAGLQESGAKEGIRFAFSQIRTVPNTLLAHGLMRFAARSRREGALAEQLFQSYFERGEDIGRRDVLEACAADAGIDRDAARLFLAADAERDWVSSIDEFAHQAGIGGVPYFVFDRRYALAGAQEAVAFLPLFDAVATTAPEMISTSL